MLKPTSFKGKKKPISPHQTACPIVLTSPFSLRKSGHGWEDKESHFGCVNGDAIKNPVRYVSGLTETTQAGAIYL
jgi:hypothetical protein